MKPLPLVAGLGISLLLGTVTAQAAPDAAAALPTRTPIKHLIVVVGENVSFDTLYAVGIVLTAVTLWAWRQPSR